jgi:threonine dehydrogenase-like Zn-dependent dehydrogenase
MPSERHVDVAASRVYAIARLSATCICGSDLRPYRGANKLAEPTPMGHEYCGIVDLFFRHVRLLGGAAPVRRYLPDLIDRVLSGRMNPGRVFDLTLPVREVADGYRAIDERRAIKTLLQAEDN